MIEKYRTPYVRYAESTTEEKERAKKPPTVRTNEYSWSSNNDKRMNKKPLSRFNFEQFPINWAAVAAKELLKHKRK